MIVPELCIKCKGDGLITDCQGYRLFCPYCMGIGRINKEEKEPNQMITLTRRFYKTHSAIQSPQILGLYSEALADAAKSIKQGTQEEYYIVEVVAVVKRQKPVVNPIVIEEVRRS